jgi:hypothetical protein
MIEVNKIYNIRKYTFEDRFARRYYCNYDRVLNYFKRRNRRMFRQKLKREIDND